MPFPVLRPGVIVCSNTFCNYAFWQTGNAVPWLPQIEPCSCGSRTRRKICVVLPDMRRDPWNSSSPAICVDLTMCALPNMQRSVPATISLNPVGSFRASRAPSHRGDTEWPHGPEHLFGPSSERQEPHCSYYDAAVSGSDVALHPLGATAMPALCWTLGATRATAFPRIGV